MGIILYTHPFYVRTREDWIRYRDLAEGDHRVLTSQEYLWPHPIELSRDVAASQLRDGREMRTRYLNLVEAIESLWGSYFFRKCYTLDKATEELLGDAEDNIDGYGTSLFSFIKDGVLKSYLRYGKVIVSVDAFSKTGKNLAEQKESGIRPFFELVQPLTAPDWELEVEDTARIGKLNFIRTEYDLILPRASAQVEPTTHRYTQVKYLKDGRYAIATYTTPTDRKGAYIRKDPDTQLAIWEQVGDEVVTQLEEIPVSIIDSEPWLHDVCEETLRFYNHRSNLDNVNYFQGYADKYVSGVTNPEQMKAFGEYVMKFLPEGGKATIIPPTQAVGLELATNESLSSVFKVGLNMFRALPSDAKGIQSSDTIEQDKDNTYAMVESSLEEIENLMNDAIKHYAAFMGQPDFEPDLELNKEIKGENFDQFLRTYAAFKDKFDQMPTLSQAITKKAVHKLELPEEDVNEGLKEIDKTQLETPEEQFNRERKAALGNISGQ